MGSLVRIVDSAFTINVRGTMADSDSGGRNFYFALQVEEEQKKKEKEEAGFSLFDTVDVTSAELPWGKSHPCFTLEMLQQLTEPYLPVFLPFQVPISQQ